MSGFAGPPGRGPQVSQGRRAPGTFFAGGNSGGRPGMRLPAQQASLGYGRVVLGTDAARARNTCRWPGCNTPSSFPFTRCRIIPIGGRALCMPYFGGATLAELLGAVQQQLPELRTGQSFLDVLARANQAAPITLTVLGPAQQHLARVSYTHAVCGLGVCLAEALQFAHDRGLVYLDLKPANVLLTADGQPMLLDFHVARSPLAPESPVPTLARRNPRLHVSGAAGGTDGDPARTGRFLNGWTAAPTSIPWESSCSRP